MNRPRFLADQDLNEHIVAGVMRTEPALEFVRARDVGLTGHADPKILEYAGQHQMLVVSHDVNTMTKAAAERIRQALPCSG